MTQEVKTDLGRLVVASEPFQDFVNSHNEGLFRNYEINIERGSRHNGDLSEKGA